MSEEKNKNNELSRRQEAALLALMDGLSLSLADIARKISVSPRTLYRWMHEDENFMREYRNLRRINVERGIARLQGLVDKAIDCLEANLTSGNRPSEVRTASTILRQAVEGVDTLEFDNRIRAIEKNLEK